MDDTISRQQAIDALRKMQTYKLFSGDDMLLIDQAGAQTELMMLPPAQPVIVPCDYAKACNKVAMNRITSAVVYMEILEDFKEYGYVLVDMSENMPLDNNSEIPNSSDTISRAKAIKEVTRNIPVKGWDDAERVTEIMRIFADRIKRLPPAQPERIKGHWIKISPANIYECSECGKSVMTNDICAYDFCHGCGAEMEVTT